MKLTLAAVNRRNRTFWKKQARLLAKRISNTDLVNAALEDLQAETSAGVPLYFRKTFEKVLDDAYRKRAALRNLRPGTSKELQREYAGGPRVKITAHGTTIDDIVQLLILRSKNGKFTAKILWRAFFQDLERRGLLPTEFSGQTIQQSYGIEYQFRTRRRKMTFKTFSNLVSKFRD